MRPTSSSIVPGAPSSAATRTFSLRNSVGLPLRSRECFGGRIGFGVCRRRHSAGIGVKRLAQGSVAMTKETSAAVEKLRRIQQLWQELGRTKSSNPEYEILVKKIRALSGEYEALLPAPKNPKNLASDELD